MVDTAPGGVGDVQGLYDFGRRVSWRPVTGAALFAITLAAVAHQVARISVDRANFAGEGFRLGDVPAGEQILFGLIGLGAWVVALVPARWALSEALHGCTSGAFAVASALSTVAGWVVGLILARHPSCGAMIFPVNLLVPGVTGVVVLTWFFVAQHPPWAAWSAAIYAAAPSLALGQAGLSVALMLRSCS